MITKYINNGLLLFTALTLASFSGCEKDEPENNDNPGEEDVIPGTQAPAVSTTPYAYFPFDGNYDDMGDHELYAYGYPDPTFTDGPFAGSKALSFSRVKKSAIIISDPLIDTRSMTVSFWAKDISEGNIFHVESLNNSGSGENKMMTLTFREGHLKFVMSRYNNRYNFDRTGNFTHKSITDGEWHHIAIVSDFSTISYSNVTTSLYIDGKLMDTITEDGNSISENHPSEAHYDTGTKFVLGGENVPNMKIARLRAYDNRQLSAKQIAEIYNSDLK